MLFFFSDMDIGPFSLLFHFIKNIKVLSFLSLKHCFWHFYMKLCKQASIDYAFALFLLLVHFANDNFLNFVHSAIKKCFGKPCAMVHFCLNI